MDRVRFVIHQDKQILLVDLTGCNAEEVTTIVGEVQRIVTAQPRESVLTLGDLTGAQFSRDAVTRMKEVAVFDRPYVKRAAWSSLNVVKGTNRGISGRLRASLRRSHRVWR